MDLPVSELKEIMLSRFGEILRKVSTRFSEKTTVTRSDGKIEFRTTLDPSAFDTKLDAFPFYDSWTLSTYQWFFISHLLKKKTNPAPPSSDSTGEVVTSEQKIKTRRTRGPTGVARAYQMRYHYPFPVAQHPRCVSICLLGYNPKLPKFMDLELLFFLNDFDDPRGPLVSVVMTSAPFGGRKRKSLMKDERKSEKRIGRDLIREIDTFQRCDPQLCGAESLNLVLIGVATKDPSPEGLYECEWCMNLWNGFFNHPYMVGSGDHVAFTHQIKLCMQMLTQVFRRAGDLIDPPQRGALNLYAWQNSPLYLRSQQSEFIRMVRLGRGQVCISEMRVKNPLLCAVSMSIRQSGCLCFTAEVEVAPVYQFNSRL